MTAVEVDSPAYDMRRAGEEEKSYYLQERNSIITHVNGLKVRTVDEFNEAIINSRRDATLTVFSTTRLTAVDFQTVLRE